MSGHNEIQLCWSISSAPFLTLKSVVTLTESYKVNVIQSKIIDSFDGFQTALLKLASKEEWDFFKTLRTIHCGNAKIKIKICSNNFNPKAITLTYPRTEKKYDLSVKQLQNYMSVLAGTDSITYQVCDQSNSAEMIKVIKADQDLDFDRILRLYPSCCKLSGRPIQLTKVCDSDCVKISTRTNTSSNPEFIEKIRSSDENLVFSVTMNESNLIFIHFYDSDSLQKWLNKFKSLMEDYGASYPVLDSSSTEMPSDIGGDHNAESSEDSLSYILDEDDDHESSASYQPSSISTPNEDFSYSLKKQNEILLYDHPKVQELIHERIADEFEVEIGSEDNMSPNRVIKIIIEPRCQSSYEPMKYIEDLFHSVETLQLHANQGNLWIKNATAEKFLEQIFAEAYFICVPHRISADLIQIYYFTHKNGGIGLNSRRIEELIKKKRLT